MPPNHITKDFLLPRITGFTLCLINDAKNTACPCFIFATLPSAEGKVAKIKQGHAVFFASFIRHRVKPVIRGNRKSLVMWFGGTPFK